MKKESTEQIKQIKSSKKRYCIKASICKFAFKKLELFGDDPEAIIEFIKLSIYYQEKVGFPEEINGLKSHLKYMKRKLKLRE